MTIGQLCFYDQVKGLLLGTPYFTDNLVTHFTSSLCAGAIATTMTQPLDVLKTRAMNAKPGEFSGALDLVRYTGRNGPMAFYKVKTQFLPRIIFYLLNIFMEPDKYFFVSGLHSGLCATGTPDHPHLRVLRAAQNEFRNNSNLSPDTMSSSSRAAAVTSSTNPVNHTWSICIATPHQSRYILF